MNNEKIVIIGAGITGLTAAERLSRSLGGRVTIIEKDDVTGGLSATLSRNGFQFDLGSHRLHTKSCKDVIRYIEHIIGEQLLRRQRKGKLYFQGKFITYPPNVYNLLKVYSSSDMLSSISRYLGNLIFPSRTEGNNFETAMIKAVGWDIYNKIYRGYARKLWGIDPVHISIDGMHRRKAVVDSRSLRNAFKVKNYFLYPRSGIGAIAAKLENAIIRNGGAILKGNRVEQIKRDGNGFQVSFASNNGGGKQIQAATLISTIPIGELYALLFPQGESIPDLKWRGIRILFMHISEELKGNAETYYFPSQDIAVGRMSEIKKYSPYINKSIKGTLLTVEIPASEGDHIWQMRDKELSDICVNDLLKTGILDKPPDLKDYFSIRLEKTYPVYEIGWRDKFFSMYDKLNRLGNLFTIGRGGLFLHCNIDHCVTQGMELAEYILLNKADSKAAWNKLVRRFLAFSARD